MSGRSPRWIQKIKNTNRVPLGYRKVEYIQSHGTEYIKTGFSPNQSSRVVCDFQYTSSEEEQTIFLSRTSTNANQFGIFHNASGWVFRYGTNAATNSSISIIARIAADIDRNTAKLNNVTMTALSSNFTSIELMLFVRNTNGSLSNYAKAKLYRCKIYDGETIIKDFVPCIRNSDNAAGLFDRVGGLFYENAGTGAFSTPAA